MTMGMALGDELLQEVWFSDSSEDEGSGGELEENFRTIISSGVCAKSTYQMEYEHNFLENFIRFYCTSL